MEITAAALVHNPHTLRANIEKGGKVGNSAKSKAPWWAMAGLHTSCGARKQFGMTATPIRVPATLIVAQDNATSRFHLGLLGDADNETKDNRKKV
ncbi:MAG: hypothetical protein NPIRA05_17220 [Nitrospirales bacterium]|nr:MAG: hypothetical protein NPIRA05_17220 [Nitrospirales bacterium]